MVTIARFTLGKKASISGFATTLILSSNEQTKGSRRASSSKSEGRTLPLATATTKETADHSLPYCIAVAVAKGNVLPSDFEEDALRDHLVCSLLDKIKVAANPEIDTLFPKIKRAIVTIKTSHGEFKKQEDFAEGQPERPLSEKELISKFKANSEKKISPSRMEDIIKATQELENIDEIGEYMKLLVSDK